MDTGAHTSRQIRWYENIFTDNIVTSLYFLFEEFQKVGKYD